jgi:subtilisin
MKILLLRLFVLFTGVGGVQLAVAADSPDTLTPAPSERALPSTGIPDRYIVQVGAGEDPRAVATSYGVSPNHVYMRAVRGFAGTVAPGRLAALRTDPRVLHVTPDRKVAAIAKPGGGGGTPSPSQTVPVGIQRIGAAPNSLPVNGAGIGVAVVDTGVDFNHNDLKPLGGASFSAFGSTAQDNNGHGTHVAGTIGARHNSIDVVGVAPAATIYAVKVLDASGSGSDSDVMAGFEWVATNADSVNPIIRVVNVSLGRAGSLNDNLSLRASVKALHTLGIAVIVAAGNDAGLEVSQQVPATYPEVIAVASTTAASGTNQSRLFNGVIPADTASYFTSDGEYDSSGIGVTVSAPGEDQENVTKAGFIQSVGILSTKLGGGTTRMSGTSMAAPHVAGVAALLYQSKPSSTSEEIRSRIGTGAVRQGVAPLNSPTGSYTFDGEREGVLSASGALAAP